MGRIVGSLPGPCFAANAGAGDILEGQLYAYGVASSIAVVDVLRLQTACMLQGGHGRAAVTAVSWNPECHTRDLSPAGHLRLASGDKEGNVVVWDVLQVAVVCKLGNVKTDGEANQGVTSLAWILNDPCLLAVVLGPATLVVWDIQGGGIVYQKDLPGMGSMHSLCVDTLDRRCMCASSDTGVCVIVEFEDVMLNRVNIKQYRVTSKASEPSTPTAGNVHCIFPAARDILLVMLTREMILFDIEFGQPIYSFRLPNSYSPFLRILGVSGQGVSVGGGIEGGIDDIHCMHEDGKVSVWSRSSEGLSFSSTSTFDLLPPPLRNPNSPLSKPNITTVSSMIWRAVNTNLRNKPSVAGGQRHERLLPTPSLLVITVMSTGQVWQWDIPLAAYYTIENAMDEPGGNTDSKQQEGSEFGAIMVGGESVTDKGENIGSPTSQRMPLASCSNSHGDPVMLRVMSNLPSAVTTLAVLPKPLLQAGPLLKPNCGGSTSPNTASIVVVEDEAQEEALDLPDETNKSGPDMSSEADTVKLQEYPDLPELNLNTAKDSMESSSSTPIMAVVTAGGTLELIPVQRGCVTAVSLEVIKSFGVHKERSRSVRWLGCSPLVVSFCTEKTDHGWKNSLMITDVRTGECAPFRELGSENAAMIGIRTSPSGRYILLLIKDSPAEIWMVSGLKNVQRGRQVEIPFTAVEWAIPDGPSYDPISIDDFENWGCSEGEDWEDGILSTDFPPETLVFAVNDGRVGIFSIKGKKVIDSKLRRPLWGALSNGTPAPLKCISVVAMGSTIILGDVEGNLTQWDLSSGKSITIPTECGPIRRLQITPSGSPDVKAKLAILSSSWQCSVWELDSRGSLSRTKFRSPKHYLDISWIPNPTSAASTSLLAAVTEEGSIAVLDTESHTASEYSPGPLSPRDDTSVTWNGTVLGGNPCLGSSLLLPNPLRLLLRMLIQIGTPLRILRQATNCERNHVIESDEDMEKEIFSRLPDNIHSFSWTRDRKDVVGGTHVHFAEDASTGEDGNGSEDWVTVPGAQSQQNQPAGKSTWMRHRNESGLDQSVFARSRNMSLASEVLASYESAESRTKVMLRRMKLAVKRKVKGHRGGTTKTPPPLTTEWSENFPGADQGIMLPSCENLLDVLRATAVLRADGNLLLPEEWEAYESALKSNSTAWRMAVAAQVSGCWEEVEFWSQLPETLKKVQSQAQERYRWKPPKKEHESPRNPSGRSCYLWTESMTLATSAERVHWHELLPRANIESHPELQDRRLLEYVCLGDYKTAVGFLLASAPEASTRYYRDSLCAIALAASHEAKDNKAPANSSLHLQVAKVVSAHAASVSDSLLGVPLLCSAGLPQDAVDLLQDSGLWRYAATLTASRLESAEHAHACQRWAQHVLSQEGSVWRSAGILVSGGCLQEAARVLKDAGFSDCASAFCECCMEAGLVHVPENGTDDEVSHQSPGQLFDALASTSFTRIEKRGSFGQRRLATSEDEQEGVLREIAGDFVQFCTQVLNVF